MTARRASTPAATQQQLFPPESDDDAAAELQARIAVSLLSEPGDRAVGSAIARDGPIATAARLGRSRVPRPGRGALVDAVAAQLDRAQTIGAVPLIPGRSGWPTQLDDLEDAAPVVLWVRGGDVRRDLLRSVSIVGARACSPYGRTQAETIAAELALFGWTVVSGGAYGIDAAAHRGALAVAGRTVLVSAGGVDRPYPAAHDHLFRQVQANGAVVSECPLGAPPARHRFLTRNRLIAALSRGTVIVEAGLKSGARSTATSAAQLSRHVMAVPGPVTSDLSSGCHDLIREGAAVLVTGSREILELVRPLAADMGEESASDTPNRAVLSILAARGPLSHDELAAQLQFGDADELIALLTILEGAGYVVRSGRGWRVEEETMRRLAGLGDRSE